MKIKNNKLNLTKDILKQYGKYMKWIKSDHKNKLWYFLILFCAVSCGMDNQSNPIARIPRDVQKLILVEVAKHDFKTNAHSLLHARCAHKAMKFLIDGISIDLIAPLKKITIMQPLSYLEKDDWATIRAALCIGTPAAIEWLKHYIAGSESAALSADRLFGCCLDNVELSDRCKVFTLSKLIDAGVSVNIASINGETPIMRAVRKANPALAKLFIEKGCAVVITNDNGDSVGDIIDQCLARAEHRKELQKTQTLYAIKKLLESKNIVQNKSQK